MSGKIEQAVAVLDEIMKLLKLPRDISISSLDDLIKVIADVSDGLMELHDHNSAGLFAKIALTLSECRGNRQARNNQRNNPSDNFQQAVLKHP